jgi:hypothetical protein
MHDLLGPGFADRADALENATVRANHRGELTELRLGGCSAERSVAEVQADGSEPFRQSDRRDRVGGRAVDDDRAGLGAGGDAVRSVDYLLDLRRAGDAEEDDARLAGEFLRRGGLRRTRRLELFDGPAIAVAHDGEGEALGENATRHAPDPCNRHR